MLSIWFFTPLVVPYVVSQVLTPILLVRYTIVASPALFLLVGRAVRTVRTVRTVRSVTSTRLGLFIAGMLVLNLSLVLPTYYGIDQKEQWRETVETVERSADADDLVVVSDAYTLAPYEYYAIRPELDRAGVDDMASYEETRRIVRDRWDVWLVLSQTEREAIVDHLRSLDYAVAEEYRYKGVRIYHFVLE